MKAMELTRIWCKLLGHNWEVAGHCTQTKPHYCPKRVVVCQRCRKLLMKGQRA